MPTRRTTLKQILAGAAVAAAATTMPAAFPSAAADEVRVALIMTGPITDGGWAQLAYEGLTELGGRDGFTVAYAENVSQANIPQVVQGYADDGFDLIIGHGFEFGSAFIEIFQNCNIFNNGAWDSWTERAVRDDRMVDLVDGQPLVFGKDHNMGIRQKGLDLEVIEFEGNPPDDIVRWESSGRGTALAQIVAEMGTRPGFPMPIGIFREDAEPTFEDRVHQQVSQAVSKNGDGDLASLLRAGSTWTVE